MSLIFDPEVTAVSFAGRRVTIIGLGKGRTTAGVAKFLVANGARVAITDAKSRDKLAEGIARLGDTPVDLVLGPSSDDAALADPDFVFVIPGERPRSATVQRAVARGIPVLTEIGLFFRLCPAPIVGVTGTKGKSTTFTLSARILEKGPKRVVAGGNIGTSIIDVLPTISPDDIVLLELSSFQLETLGRSPHVAVVTNVFEDHLDHHGTRDAYVAAKRNILAWQGPRDVAVLNVDDPTTIALHTGVPSEIRGYSVTLRPKHGAYRDADGTLALVDGPTRTPLLHERELRVPGRHNVANVLAAAIVGDLHGIAPDAIADAIRSFGGLPHRLEVVTEADGVLYVNDSQGTTPYATIPALSAYGRPAVVILGGVSKGADWTELARAVVKDARGAVLIGQAADEIAAALDRAGAPKKPLPVQRAATLPEAVRAARAMARPGDVVLLSPAAGSFDMFSSYEERGEVFRAAARELAQARA
ncbi:MAG TPA: UDP-N-acetylmuramoyl-L-alanine--D-glutamate ligase [Candidatus Limnocylindria bacterium]|nr:UDP-N-acetylmuramoyl-L-alanine--D-glutamate ligase [Candidatus Limnocylindria bacterium]